MFDLTSPAVPVIAAPMAGGPSTPELVIAAAHGGGLGFLAAGYKTPDAVGAEIDAVADARITYGVNIFAPGRPLRDRRAVERYREALGPLARHLGIDLPDIVDADDDRFDAKVDLMIERRVPLVSFTFGLPSREVVDRLHEAGILVIASVADPADATRALAVGVDALCVQGAEAGGHRATLDIDAVPNTTSTLDLLGQIGGLTDVPLIAAGGIGDGPMIDDCLAAGAVAVQVGTALLDADEAGTNAVHRAALRDPAFDATTVTRAFSGRPARALRNRFIEDFDAAAPAEYPTVHHLTSPIRKAAIAAGDPSAVNLWAGAAHRGVRGGSATEIIAGLWADTAAAASARSVR